MHQHTAHEPYGFRDWILSQFLYYSIKWPSLKWLQHPLLAPRRIDFINSTYTGDKTPLMVATESGNLQALKLLIDAGANINSQDKLGETALMMAAHLNNKPMVSALLEVSTTLPLHWPYCTGALYCAFSTMILLSAARPAHKRT